MRFSALLATLVMAGGLAAAPQQAPRPTPEPDQRVRTEPEAIYGRIKEVKGGEKIVIAIDNRPDKTYNLADDKATVTVAADLAVGDKVKVLETETNDMKSVQVVRDTRDQERSRTQEDSKRK